MDLIELMKTTPESLAETQLAALRKAVISRLGKLAGYIESGRWDEAGKMLADSPSEDGHGCDNVTLDFSDMLPPAQDGCATDIGDVIDRLRHLSVMVVKPKAGK
jgi:hypothetical protein